MCLRKNVRKIEWLPSTVFTTKNTLSAFYSEILDFNKIEGFKVVSFFFIISITDLFGGL